MWQSPNRCRLVFCSRLPSPLRQEAYDIYKKIEQHPAPGVAKKAKRMLFGWKAAEVRAGWGGWCGSGRDSGRQGSAAGSPPGAAAAAARVQNLKTDRISYQPTTAAWKRYFDRINRDSVYNNAYVAAEDESGDSGSGTAAAAALAVVAAPLVLVAVGVLLQRGAP